MRSKINTAMNVVASKITNVEIFKCQGNSIMSIEFKDGQKKFINTATSVISSSCKQACNKKDTTCNIQKGRITTVLQFSEYPSGTRIQIGTLIALALEKYNNITRDTYCGLDMNHKDRTGNISVYGYINNNLYNVEIVEKSLNDRHWRCLERVQKICNKHVAFSANNIILMDLIEYGNKEEIEKYINKNIDFIDEHETIYLI